MQGELWATRLEARTLELQNKALRRQKSDAALIGKQACHPWEKESWQEHKIGDIEKELKSQEALVSNLMRDFSSAYDQLARRPDLLGYSMSQSATDGDSVTGRAPEHSKHFAKRGLDASCYPQKNQCRDDEKTGSSEVKWLKQGSSQELVITSSTTCGTIVDEPLLYPHSDDEFVASCVASGTTVENYPQCSEQVLEHKDVDLLLGERVQECIDPPTQEVDLDVVLEPSTQQPCRSSLLPFCDGFSRFRLGTNLAISDDARTVTRERGCRQAVAIGNGPLLMNDHGWYFEVEVLGVISGWMGGLGIGVTLQTMASLAMLPERLPDKASRLPNTYVAGYWGRIFCDGKEHRTVWNAESLEVKDRVGFMVTIEGELIVFVNGRQKAWLNAGILVPTKTDGRLLLPVVDVFSATTSISLVRDSEAPMPPWSAPPTPLDALSPGSPQSALGSPICMKH